jgi:AraC-like DNA-binding protein
MGCITTESITSQAPSPAGGPRARPAARLRPFVTSYIEFDMAGWPPGRHRGLPASALTIVLSLGEPVTISSAGHAGLRVAASVAGLRTQPVDILHNGTQRGLQLELSPRGARALLGVPAAALAECVCPLGAVIGSRADELIERLDQAPGQAGRRAVLDQVLTGWAVDEGFPPAVEAAWHQLVALNGTRSVASVADQVGLGRRQLNQVVRTELGLAPKTVAKIARFGRAREHLSSGRVRSLAEAAAVCGYFDQAHMNHDWKQLGACTPGEWMASELPFLQDHGERPAAG